MGRPPLRLGRPKGRPQAPFQPSHENRYPFTNWSTFAPPKWSKFTPPLTALGEQLRALSRSLEDMLHLAQMDQDIPSTTQYALDSANRIAEDISRLVRSVEEESREPSSTENRPKAAS